MLRRKRGLAPSSQTLMHSPDSTHELAHLREASGPSPVRTISSTPAIVACGSASAMPAAAVIGQASKHLPHLVQAESISSVRACRVVSNAADIAFILRSDGLSPNLGVGKPHCNWASVGRFRRDRAVVGAKGR